MEVTDVVISYVDMLEPLANLTVLYQRNSTVVVSFEFHLDFRVVNNIKTYLPACRINYFGVSQLGKQTSKLNSLPRTLR